MLVRRLASFLKSALWMLSFRLSRSKGHQSSSSDESGMMSISSTSWTRRPGRTFWPPRHTSRPSLASPSNAKRLFMGVPVLEMTLITSWASMPPTIAATGDTSACAMAAAASQSPSVAHPGSFGLASPFERMKLSDISQSAAPICSSGAPPRISCSISDCRSSAAFTHVGGTNVRPDRNESQLASSATSRDTKLRVGLPRVREEPALQTHQRASIEGDDRLLGAAKQIDGPLLLRSPGCHHNDVEAAGGPSARVRQHHLQRSRVGLDARKRVQLRDPGPRSFRSVRPHILCREEKVGAQVATPHGVPILQSHGDARQHQVLCHLCGEGRHSQEEHARLLHPLLRRHAPQPDLPVVDLRFALIKLYYIGVAHVRGLVCRQKELAEGYWRQSASPK
eukprot:scaffold529_cov308-Pinguiococcus_pyrenoidosus.AAC.84